MGFRVSLSMAVLSSCLLMNVFCDGGVDDNVSWTLHHAPSYQPVAAPAPHHHHHHHKLASPPMAHAPSKAPVYAPIQPPTKAPVQPPTSKAPVQPPSSSPAPVHPQLPARKLVAVQGVVYCKACKYKGVDTLLGATPLQGAEVLLSCNNTKYPLRVKGTSDKNGYFFIKPPKTLTTYGFHKCNVRLMTSPMASCNEPTDLHGGLDGSKLVPNKKPPLSNPLPYEVFTVGPLAFQPSSKTPCPRESMED